MTITLKEVAQRRTVRRRRQMGSNGTAREYSRLSAAMTLREELAPIIQAGTARGVALDAAADLRALREERFPDAV